MTSQDPGFPVQYGRYTLLRKLAQGGMAELFLATDPREREPVVIKRVLPHFTSDTEFLSMFLNEARIASQLSHPSIVRVFDLGQEGGHLYQAMEFLDGFDLETVTRAAGGMIPPEIAASIGISICDALFYAYTQPDRNGRPMMVIHRDVTPGNVMLTRQGTVKLVDFGIAKAAAQLERTRPGVVKGKFRYMAPEQIEQKELDARSDLFSLGVLIYEVTTGRKPFYRPQIIDIIRALTTWSPPPAAELIPGYPRKLSDVLVTALERDRNRRFPDARAMQRALEATAPRGLPGQAELAGFLSELIRTVPDKLGCAAAPVASASAAAPRPTPPPRPAASRPDGPVLKARRTESGVTRAEVRRTGDGADRRIGEQRSPAAPARSPTPRTSQRREPPAAVDVREQEDTLEFASLADSEDRTTTNPSPAPLMAPPPNPWDLSDEDDDAENATVFDRPVFDESRPPRAASRSSSRPALYENESPTITKRDGEVRDVVRHAARAPKAAKASKAPSPPGSARAVSEVSEVSGVRRVSSRQMLALAIVLLAVVLTAGGWLLSEMSKPREVAPQLQPGSQQLPLETPEPGADSEPAPAAKGQVRGRKK